MASPRILGLTVDPSERELILEHIERILVDPVFRNSRRYSGLLRYVVERTLEGQSDQLKERNLGVEVFGRRPDYDTNSDHCVRSAAGEVRRRLAQYYLTSGDTAVRIELPSGSYVPQFRVSPPPAPPAAVEPPVPVHVPGVTGARRRMGAAVGGLLALLAIGTAWTLFAQPSAFQRFWNPVLKSPGPALICVGGGSATEPLPPGPPVTVREFDLSPARRMHRSDALAMASLAAMLQSNGKSFRFLNRAHDTSFRELQEGPAILIGALNNEWTMLLTEPLRFHIERTPDGVRIMDRQDSSRSAWNVNLNQPIEGLTRDYAIVARLYDSKTETTKVIVAGLLGWGTRAAAEFAVSHEQLQQLEKRAPRGWAGKNVEAVISAEVVNGSSGLPRIEAAHFW
jgi:hypothetical protein